MLKKLKVWWYIRALWRARTTGDFESVVRALVDLGDMECFMPLVNMTLGRPALRGAPVQTDIRWRVMASQGLKKLGAPGVQRLIEELQNEDEEVRGLAVDTLGEMNDKHAVAPLMASLNDASSAVRSKAAWALRKLKDARAAEALASALQDSDENVCRRAAWALAELGDGRSFSPLVLMLSDADQCVGHRKLTAQALAALGDERAIAPLCKAFDAATDNEFRDALAFALERLNEPSYRQKLSEEAEAKAEREKSEMMARIEGDRSIFSRNKTQLVTGLSYTGVMAILGPPTQTIGGADVMNGFGKVGGAARGAAMTSGMVFVEWKRKEGSYRATFMNGALTELNAWPTTDV